MLVLSANKTNLPLGCLMEDIYIYIIKKRGPQIEPYGTPHTVFLSEDVYLCCVKFMPSIWVISTNCE
jgi:hypothetical protein